MRGWNTAQGCDLQDCWTASQMVLVTFAKTKVTPAEGDRQ